MPETQLHSCLVAGERKSQSKKDSDTTIHTSCVGDIGEIKPAVLCWTRFVRGTDVSALCDVCSYLARQQPDSCLKFTVTMENVCGILNTVEPDLRDPCILRPSVLRRRPGLTCQSSKSCPRPMADPHGDGLRLPLPSCPPNDESQGNEWVSVWVSES